MAKKRTVRISRDEYEQYRRWREVWDTVHEQTRELHDNLVDHARTLEDDYPALVEDAVSLEKAAEAVLDLIDFVETGHETDRDDDNDSDPAEDFLDQIVQASRRSCHDEYCYTRHVDHGRPVKTDISFEDVSDGTI